MPCWQSACLPSASTAPGLVRSLFSESHAIIEKIRPGAEAAVKLGGKAVIGGKEALRLLGQQPRLPSLVWLYFLGALSTLPLIVRRRFPDIVHPLIFSGFLLTLWVFPLDVQIASLTAWVSTYTFAAYGRANERVRERVELHNGNLSTGPTTNGGFTVDASLVGARSGSTAIPSQPHNLSTNHDRKFN